MNGGAKLLYLYLGRRGAMPRFTLDLMRAAPAPVLIAAQSELAGAFDALPGPVVKARLFASGPGAMLQAWRIGALRQALARLIKETRPDAVIELMPHLWSPFLEDVPRRMGVRRVAVLHDWRRHPGDLSGLANAWLTGSALRADRILTLSRYVADLARAARPDLSARITPLFHPDFPTETRPRAEGDRPLRVLFMGRLLAYKGLDLLVQAAAEAKHVGVALEISVCGEGDIRALRAPLAALGATVVNRWLSQDEIHRALQDCDVVAATYKEASQSGVVAAAFGAGRAVIATPVGALPEQVDDEHTGLVTRDVSAGAIAAALRRFAEQRDLLSHCEAEIARRAPQRSMAAFAAALAAAA